MIKNKYVLYLLGKLLKNNKNINLVLIVSILVGILVPFILMGNISLLYRNYKNLEFNNDSYNYCIDIMDNRMIDNNTYNRIMKDLRPEDMKISIYDRVYVDGREDRSLVLKTIDTRSKSKYRMELMEGDSISKASKECLINYKLSRYINKGIGDEISIGMRKYVVKGIFKGEMTDIYVSSSDYADYLNSINSKHQQWLYLKSSSSRGEIEGVLSSIGIHDNYDITEDGDDLKHQLSEYRINIRNEIIMSLMCFIYLVVNLFIIIRIKTAKNKKLIYMLSALGMGKKKIYSLVFSEIALLSLIPVSIVLLSVILNLGKDLLINYVNINAIYLAGVVALTFLLIGAVSLLSLREYFSKTVIGLISDGDRL